MNKLTQPQLQAIVSIGVFGHKAKVGNTVAGNLLSHDLIEFDNAYQAWFLTDKGRDLFCYVFVERGMDPFGDGLPDYVKDEVKKTWEKHFD